MKIEPPRIDINAEAQSVTEIRQPQLSTPGRQDAKAQRGEAAITGARTSVRSISLTGVIWRIEWCAIVGWRSGINSALRECLRRTRRSWETALQGGIANGLAPLRLGAVALILLPLCLLAATNDLSSALQKGLFEEEANRNLDAAIQAYQSVAARFDKDRQLAATAIFRLGECYRKLGKTNEAVAQYERIVQEFSDQQTLVTLSRQNLGGLRALVTITGLQKTVADEQEVSRLEAELLDTRARARQTADRLAGYVGAKNYEDMLTLVSDEALKELFRENTELSRRYESLKAARAKDDPELAEARKKLDENQQQLEAANQRYQDSLDLQLRGLNAQAAVLQDRLDRARGLTAGGSVPTQSLETELALLKAQLEQARRETNNLTSALIVARLFSVPLSELNSFGDLGKDALPKLIAYQELRVRALESAIAQARSPVATDGSKGNASHVANDDEEKEIRRIQAMVKDSPDLINAIDFQAGAAPLHKAAELGQLRVAEFLLANGANTEAKDRGWGGRTPLHFAASSGHKAMVELLLSKKAEVQSVDNHGRTPLHLAALKGNKSVIEVLMAHGADVAAKTKAGGTALHIAAANGFKSIAELLLAHGADVNANTSREILTSSNEQFNGTPLYIAAKRGDQAMAELLLANKAKLNAQSDSGGTSLLVAEENGHDALVGFLLARGADVNIGDKNGTTPLLRAVANDWVDIVRVLLEHKANPNVVGLTSAKGQNNAHNYPLRVAIENGNTEILKILLENGANPNFERTEAGKYVGPALFAAIGKKQNDAVELLLKFKADPNRVDKDGFSPLMRAVEAKNNEIVALLVAGGADLNLTGKDGWTALHLAVAYQSKEITALLLTKGADRNKRRTNGETPLDIAKSQNAAPPSLSAEIADLLRQHGALDDLPDFSSIRITRGSLKPILVFSKDTNSLNHFTLLEAIRNYYASVYSGSVGVPVGSFSDRLSALTAGVAGNPLRFPDFSRITVYRPASGKIGERKEIVVNVLTPTNNMDCSKDLPLEFGDVIEIPEREHTLAEQAITLTGQQSQDLSKCTERKVRFLVRGEVMEISVPGGAYLASALQFPDVQKLLRSSSDLSRLKVKRTDPKTGKTQEIPMGTANKQLKDDLWLRDGDVIEVPDKP